MESIKDDPLKKYRPLLKDTYTYEDLKALVEALEDDVNKFYQKGNKIAGTRVRKVLQEVKSGAQDIRVHIQDTKNAI